MNLFDVLLVAEYDWPWFSMAVRPKWAAAGHLVDDVGEVKRLGPVAICGGPPAFAQAGTASISSGERLRSDAITNRTNSEIGHAGGSGERS